MRAENPNPHYCVEEVHDTFGGGFSQCGNRQKAGSEFCGTHSPEAQARRDAKSTASYQAWKEKALAPSRKIEHLEAINADLLAALREARAAIQINNPAGASWPALLAQMDAAIKKALPA